MRTLGGFRIPSANNPALLVGCLVVATAVQTQGASVSIAEWRFDEASGSLSTDSSGNGHTGTIVGAVMTVGQTGGGLSFDGVNDYVFASDAQSGGTTGAV